MLNSEHFQQQLEARMQRIRGLFLTCAPIGSPRYGPSPAVRENEEK